jgi:hypothetical protein
MFTSVEQLDAPFALPEECQELYSPKMTDKEIEKLANALNKLQYPLVDLSDLKSDLAVAKGSLDWHKTIGWWAIGLAGAAAITLFGLLFIHVPSQLKAELAKNREDTKQDTRNAIAEGTIPLRESLAAMKATLDLWKPEAVRRLPELMKENLKQQQDADLGMRIVGSLAEKARDNKISTDPAQLAAIGETIRQVSAAHPEAARTAFGAMSSLISYRSFLNQFNSPNTAASVPVDPGDFTFVIRPNPKPEGRQGMIKVLGGAISFEKGARGELIGYPIEERKTAPEFYVVRWWYGNSGGRVLLQECHL